MGLRFSCGFPVVGPVIQQGVCYRCPRLMEWARLSFLPWSVISPVSEILAKSTLMTLAIKKCLYSDLTIRLSYCSFCKFRLQSCQRYCRADGKLGVLAHCWTRSSSPFQAECEADLQWDIEYSARPLV